ncbi:MAG: hypothetical protein EBU88_18525 [Acidobacteria bacterium]|nr:hypothetical protein [Acidobacteriota bacterium]
MGESVDVKELIGIQEHLADVDQNLPSRTVSVAQSLWLSMEQFQLLLHESPECIELLIARSTLKDAIPGRHHLAPHGRIVFLLELKSNRRVVYRRLDGLIVRGEGELSGPSERIGGFVFTAFEHKIDCIIGFDGDVRRRSLPRARFDRPAPGNSMFG